MSAWRSTELETLFGGPLNESYLTEAVLERLASSGIRETDQLDFKGVPSGSVPYAKAAGPRTGWLKEQEFAKDVASFANHRGGALVLGMEADGNGVATRTTPIAVSDSSVEEQRLRAALVNHAAPFIDCSFIPIKGADGWYCLVIVPPSRRSPHCVVSDRGDTKTALHYPVRHGSDTVWLNESEVAERYRRRVDAFADDRARVESVIQNGLRTLNLMDGFWLWVAAVPEMPAEGGVLDNDEVQRVELWHRSENLISPRQLKTNALGRGIAGPGRVSFARARRSGGEDESLPDEDLAELYLDGSAFAAQLLSIEIDPQSGIDMVMQPWLLDQLILLMDEALRWAAQQAGAWNVATVAVGIEDASEVPGCTRSITLGTYYAGGSPVRRDRTRVVPYGAPPRTETIADLGAVGSLQQRLIVVRRAADGLLQWFGIAEADEIARTGAIDARNWGTSDYQRARQWARHHGVEVVVHPGDT